MSSHTTTAVIVHHVNIAFLSSVVAVLDHEAVRAIGAAVCREIAMHLRATQSSTRHPCNRFRRHRRSMFFRLCRRRLECSTTITLRPSAPCSPPMRLRLLSSRAATLNASFLPTCGLWIRGAIYACCRCTQRALCSCWRCSSRPTAGRLGRDRSSVAWRASLRRAETGRLPSSRKCSRRRP